RLSGWRRDMEAVEQRDSKRSHRHHPTRQFRTRAAGCCGIDELFSRPSACGRKIRRLFHTLEAALSHRAAYESDVWREEHPMLETQPQDESPVATTRWMAPPQTSAPASSEGYDVGQHPVHPRLKQIEIRPSILAALLADVWSVDVQNLQ